MNTDGKVQCCSVGVYWSLFHTLGQWARVAPRDRGVRRQGPGQDRKKSSVTFETGPHDQMEGWAEVRRTDATPSREGPRATKWSTSPRKPCSQNPKRQTTETEKSTRITPASVATKMTQPDRQGRERKNTRKHLEKHGMRLLAAQRKSAGAFSYASENSGRRNACKSRRYSTS